mmetsp:Transcript_10056/g.17273  ORF Transcript_10056/g.17273 Transcript_10056/m.17273 type:complete len:252 (+) Transcript_10056:106-861(+)|eukprot:CAMPEP_0198206298 /NCGR_PEP_ID=MMETSP1445-20131203/9833_1 /TAXON_ID=36898 /ORGANISM="Pyramimonas sp., Strain CCMP2087" /LENGTH=251 /DNA_ID=CAMNT_0043878945 /DNA_START=79 /DNA_END=834 /DNA_ORIENTATION=-
MVLAFAKYTLPLSVVRSPKLTPSGHVTTTLRAQSRAPERVTFVGTSGRDAHFAQRQTLRRGTPERDECYDEDGCEIPDDYVPAGTLTDDIEAGTVPDKVKQGAVLMKEPPKIEKKKQGGFFGRLFGGGKKKQAHVGGELVTVTTKAQWDDILTCNPGRTIVLDCSMDFCGPCKVVHPTFKMYAENYKDSVFCKISGDTNKETKEIMSSLNVSAVPAFFIFKDGQQKFNHVGADMKPLRSAVLANLSPGDAR